LNSFPSQSVVIAIVDDDEPLREALASLLKAAGCAVTTFARAEDFLASADWRDTSCLILDVRLPGMSGVELQHHLKGAGSAFPIIFVTAHGDSSLEEVLLKAGASAFLNKPVRSDRLLKEIDTALARPEFR
jgi:FixJ family two-component response regulator